MNPQRLLELLSESGITLTANDGKLRATAPPGRITPELAAQIKAHKPALLALLQQASHLAVNGAHPSSHQTAGAANGPANARVHPANVAARAVTAATVHASKKPVPLSVTQVRQAGAARSGNALPIVLRLLGPMDRGALKQSLEYTLQRHAPLRSSFQLDKDPPTQLEQDLTSLPLEVTDLEKQPDPQARALALVRDLTATPFDVTRPPLMRAHLIRMSDAEHWLFTSFSPLVIDGWSFDVFWQELRTAYIAFTSGQKHVPLPELEASYAQLSQWQSQRVEERRAVLEAFWKQALGQQLPRLPLPTDYPRPPLSNNRGGNITYVLAPEIEAELRRLARSSGSTPQMLMLTAFYVWLHRLSGETELVVAGPAAARLHPASEAVIGPFVNIMLLRMSVQSEATFADLVADVRDRCLEAYDHQELPLEQLKVRSAPGPGGSFAPAFQAEFSFQMVSNRDKDMGSLRIEQLELPSGAATNDITMWVKDWGSQIKGAVEYKLELYSASTIQGWVDCFVHLLGQLVLNPSKAVGTAELTPAQTASQVRNRLRDLSAPVVESALGTSLQGKRITDVELVDAASSALPIGCYGRLIVTTEKETLESAARVRLTHDNRLEVESTAPQLQRTPTSYREPTTDLERQLVDILTSLLGDTSIGVDHDFFESGGNSLLAVRLFNEIASRTGVRLPFTVILEAPTAAKLAMRIKGGAGATTACLLKLRDGSSPFGAYFVHDGDGETLLYRNLAERMPSGIPVYGVNPKAKDPIPCVHTSVEGMAAHYVTEIRKHQPEGPYIVGGLCAGGVIAYEVARRLAEEDADTTLLLLDSAPPFAKRKQTALTHRMTQVAELGKLFTSGANVGALRAGLKRLSGGVRYELGHRMERASSRLQIEAVKQLANRSVPWPSWLPVPSFRDIWNYAEARYRGTPTEKLRAILVRATSGHGGDQPSRDILSDPWFDWQQLIQSPIRAYDVPGGHSTMLQLPHVEELSLHLVGMLPSLTTPSPSSNEASAIFALASA